MNQAENITKYLNDWSSGDPEALEKVESHIRPHLENIARRRFADEPGNHTMETGDLINELYLKLMRQNKSWESRRHFYAVSAVIMRQILIDNARRHRAAKRGNQMRVHISTDYMNMMAKEELSVESMFSLEEALCKLEQLNARQARILEWSFFFGMKQSEIAAALDLDERSVRRDLKVARAYIKGQVRGAHQ